MKLKRKQNNDDWIVIVFILVVYLVPISWVYLHTFQIDEVVMNQFVSRPIELQGLSSLPIKERVIKLCELRQDVDKCEITYSKNFGNEIDYYGTIHNNEKYSPRVWNDMIVGRCILNKCVILYNDWKYYWI